MRAILLGLFLLVAPVWADREYVLSRAPGAKVVSELQRSFPRVRFTMHPTQNGFLADGSPLDLRALDALVPGLDVLAAPQPRGPWVRVFVPLRPEVFEEISGLLATFYICEWPQMDRERSGWWLEGAPWNVDEAKRMLEQMNAPRPVLTVTVTDGPALLLETRPAEGRVTGLVGRRSAATPNWFGSRPAPELPLWLCADVFNLEAGMVELSFRVEFGGLTPHRTYEWSQNVPRGQPVEFALPMPGHALRFRVTQAD